MNVCKIRQSGFESSIDLKRVVFNQNFISERNNFFANSENSCHYYRSNSENTPRQIGYHFKLTRVFYALKKRKKVHKLK